MIKRVNDGVHWGLSAKGAGSDWVLSSRKDLIRRKQKPAGMPVVSCILM